MQTASGLDIIWWITAVELPALAGLFWIGWRNFHSAQNEIDQVRHVAEVGLAHLRQNLDAYKLDVAKSYVSISYLRDVEERLTGHLIRIEEKLDLTRTERAGGAKLTNQKNCSTLLLRKVKTRSKSNANGTWICWRGPFTAKRGAKRCAARKPLRA